MPGPITHVVLVEKVFDKYFANFSRGLFLVGTSFPDIRNIVSFDRRETHTGFGKGSLVKIKQAEDFTAGVSFHSFVDWLWCKHLKESGLYKMLGNREHIVASLKLFEDQLLYEKVDCWSEIISFMDKILPQELTLRIKEKDLKKWHRLIQYYFARIPTPETRKNFFQISEEKLEKIEANIEIFKTQESFVKLVVGFYKNFEKLIEY